MRTTRARTIEPKRNQTNVGKRRLVAKQTDAGNAFSDAPRRIGWACGGVRRRHDLAPLLAVTASSVRSQTRFEGDRVACSNRSWGRGMFLSQAVGRSLLPVELDESEDTWQMRRQRPLKDSDGPQRCLQRCRRGRAKGKGRWVVSHALL